MAIVNNLGGGGYVDTGIDTARAVGAIQGNQQMAQQNLQESQKNAFAYLQMLPQLAQQMGYAPEQMHLFLQEQAPQIMGQLGVLGVPNPKQAFDGMIKETTLGQRVAGETAKFTDARTAELEALADQQGLTGTARSEFILAGSPGTTTKVPVESTAQPQEEVKQNTMTFAGDSDEIAKNLTEVGINPNNISGAVVLRNAMRVPENYAQLSEEDKVIFDDLSNKITDKQIDLGANPNQLDPLLEMYNRYKEGVPVGGSSVKQTTMTSPGNFTYEIPAEYRGQLNEKSIRDLAASAVEDADRTNPEYASIYDQFSEQEKQTAIKRLLDRSIGKSPGNIDPVNIYIAQRALMEQGAPITETSSENVPPAEVAQIQGQTFTAPPAETAQAPAQGQQFREVTTGGTMGLTGSVQGLFNKVQAQNPLAAQSVMPGEQANRGEEARINYLNLQARAMGQAGDAKLISALNEVELAALEADQETKKMALENLYKSRENAFNAKMEAAKSPEDKVAIADAFMNEMQNTVNELGYNTQTARDEYGNRAIFEEVSKSWFERTLPKLFTPEQYGQIFGGGTSNFLGGGKDEQVDQEKLMTELMNLFQ